MERNKKQEDEHQQNGRPTAGQDWEIDPSNHVIKSVIARATFGTVRRGVYDGLNIAETSSHSGNDNGNRNGNENPVGAGLLNPMVTQDASTLIPLAVDVPALSMVPSVMASHAEKLEKFTYVDFKRWQKKMLFYLTTLGLVRFLTDDPPVVDKNETNKEVLATQNAWKHSNFLCRNYVLNCLHDTLYNVYSVKKSAKELWESLDMKYKIEHARSKKLVVGRFLGFKIVDTRTMISQVHDFHVILQDIFAEGMSLSETFQVAALIEKLPPAWKDFKNYLKHKRSEMKMEDLIIRIRIEEDNKGAERKVGRPHSFQKKGKHRVKGSKLGPIGGITKKTKFQFKDKCFNCDKTGHHATDCRQPKRRPYRQPPQAKPSGWWVGTGATHHICSDKKMFTSFEPVTNVEKLIMANFATSNVEGKGKVKLKMTSGKELTLNNVLYVPDVSKNFVSGSLLSKHGFRMVFEADKVMLTKAGVYVGKGYLIDGLFNLNLIWE